MSELNNHLHTDASAPTKESNEVRVHLMEEATAQPSPASSTAAASAGESVPTSSLLRPTSIQPVTNFILGDSTQMNSPGPTVDGVNQTSADAPKHVSRSESLVGGSMTDEEEFDQHHQAQQQQKMMLGLMNDSQTIAPQLGPPSTLDRSSYHSTDPPIRHSEIELLPRSTSDPSTRAGHVDLHRFSSSKRRTSSKDIASSKSVTSTTTGTPTILPFSPSDVTKLRSTELQLQGLHDHESKKVIGGKPSHERKPSKLDLNAPPLQPQTSGTSLNRTQSKYLSPDQHRSPAVMDECTQPKRCRCSFLGMFTTLSILQVIIACVLIWLIGYLSTLNSIEGLTADIRHSVLDSCSTQLNIELAKPFQATSLLDRLTRIRFGDDWAVATNVSNRTGWLGSVSFVAAQYPTLARLGVTAATGMGFLVSKINSTQRTFSAQDGGVLYSTIGVADPITHLSLLTSYTIYHNATTTDEIYHSSEINPFEPPKLADIGPFDSAETIADYLGPPVLIQNNYPIFTRPFYSRAIEMQRIAQSHMLAAGLPVKPIAQSGWSDVFAGRQYRSSLVFQSVSHVRSWPASEAAALNFTGGTSSTALGVSWAFLNIDGLNELTRTFPVGEHGAIYVFDMNGNVLCSSLVYQPKFHTDPNSTEIIADPITIAMPWIVDIQNVLRGWGFVAPEGVFVTALNSSSLLTSVLMTQTFEDTIKMSQSNNYGSYTIQARLLDSTLTDGLDYTVVLVTKDDDYLQQVNTNIRNAALLAAGVTLLAAGLSFLITHFTTSPLLTVIGFMGRANLVMSGDRDELLSRRKALLALADEWSEEYHGVNKTPNPAQHPPPELTPAPGTTDMSTPLVTTAVLPSLPTPSPTTSVIPLTKTKASSSSSSFNKDKSSKLAPKSVSTLHGLFDCGGRIREVNELRCAFHSMLQSLTSYDELEVINRSKRQFIRYIFHEVRVPFNAIVLGIEQLHTTQKAIIDSFRQTSASPTFSSSSGSPIIKLHDAEHTMEILDILAEQSQVVSRILNDVLSMQKIEDGALELSFDLFKMETLLRNCLNTFRNACIEKRIRLKIRFERMNHWIGERLPGLLLGIRRDARGVIWTDAMVQEELERRVRISKRGAVDAHLYHPPPMTFLVNQLYCRGDAYRLRQVVANLVSNAIKFSHPKGLVRVTLEMSNFIVDPVALVKYGPGASPLADNTHLPREEEKEEIGQPGSTPVITPPTPPVASSIFHVPPPSVNNNMPTRLGVVTVRIGIKDHGIGISQEDMENLFKEYVQINPSALQKGGGTGLGLSISKSIINLHGGTIGVRSNASPNVGSSTYPRTAAGPSHTPEPSPSSPVHRHNSPATIHPSTSHSINVLSTSPNMDKREVSSPPVPEKGSEFFIILPLELYWREEEVSTTSLDHSSLNHGSLLKSSSLYGPSVNVESNRHDGESVGLQRRDEEAVHEQHQQVGVSIPTATTMMDTDTPHPVPSRSKGVHERQISISLDPIPVSEPSCTTPELGAKSSQSTPHTPQSGTGPRRLLNLSGFSLGRQDGATTPVNDLSKAVGQLEKTMMAPSNVPASAINVNVTPPSTTNPNPSGRRMSIGRDLLPTFSAAHPVGIKPGYMVAAFSPPGATPTSEVDAEPSISASLFAASTADPLRSPTTTTFSSTQPLPMRRLVNGPANATSMSASVPETPVPRPPAHSKATSPGARVLVVEDSLPNRKLLMSLLTLLKCHPTGAVNGQECVDLFPEHPDTDQPLPFDLILMDGSMPVLNGIEATHILRQRGIEIPIVAVTGNALAEDVNAFMTAGANEVLTKPVSKSKLESAISRYYGASVSTASTATTESTTPNHQQI